MEKQKRKEEELVYWGDVTFSIQRWRDVQQQHK